jgi:titin
VPGAGNLISGNQRNGIDLNGSGNLVQGNRIGTDVTGTQALGNGFDGVFIGAAGGNTIGGTAAGAGNLISGNRDDGIELDGGLALVQGNQIGTDFTGTQALGNGFDGVAVAGDSLDTLGETAAGAGNLISGNARDGIEIVYGLNNTIQGNHIGTDITGTQALGNGRNGITLIASSTTVGGTTAAANIIAANGGSGVVISGVQGYARFSLIESNFIGTDATATLNMGNAADGVTINQSASNNTIGGTAAGAGNVIAFNGHDGVLVDTGTGNAILSDLIFANGNLGIELINNGNHNQAAPVLTGAFPDGPNMVIQGVLQSTPNTTFTVQLFSDPSADSSGLAEGQQLLGTVTVTTDAFGFADFTVTVSEAVPAGQVVAATATDADNNSSEFSAPVTVTGT